MPSASVSIDAGPSGPGAARRFTRRVMSSCPEALTDRATLLVSELVTNAVLHGRGRPQVTIDLTAEVVRVSVADESPTLPRRPTTTTESTNGRGLAMVEAFADGWGVEPEGDGKRVWFELRV